VQIIPLNLSLSRYVTPRGEPRAITHTCTCAVVRAVVLRYSHLGLLPTRRKPVPRALCPTPLSAAPLSLSLSLSLTRSRSRALEAAARCVAPWSEELQPSATAVARSLPPSPSPSPSLRPSSTYSRIKPAVTWAHGRRNITWILTRHYVDGTDLTQTFKKERGFSVTFSRPLFLCCHNSCGLLPCPVERFATLCTK
jgi:hypothetical protein